MRIAKTMIACAALGACTVNGVTKWPGKGDGAGGAGGGSAARGGGGGGGGALPAGIPGGICDAETSQRLHDDHGYDGVCWDPPGDDRESARLPPAAIAGRREIQIKDASAARVFWFDMPPGIQGGSTSYCPWLEGDRPDWTFEYQPFAQPGGFPAWTVPDFTGQSLDAALDTIDALDLPACVTVRYDSGCELGHHNVCMQSQTDEPIRLNGDLTLVVATDITDEGTPDERRRLPDVTGTATDDALADLARRGFTNVKVVEDNVPCERGIVCMADPGPGFWPPDGAIVLTVRRAKK